MIGKKRFLRFQRFEQVAEGERLNGLNLPASPAGVADGRQAI
jgi:hypothetical protein